MSLLSSAILSGGSIIDLDGTFAIQFVIFAIAFFGLRVLVFRPMVALFEAREEAIDGAKEEAKRLQAEAAAAGDSFDEQLREVRLKAGEERDRLRAEGQRMERAVLSKVQDDANKQLQDADAKMKIEAARIRRELEVSIPQLAESIVTKLLQRGNA